MPKLEEIFPIVALSGAVSSQRETRSKFFSRLFCFEQEKALKLFGETIYK